MSHARPPRADHRRDATIALETIRLETIDKAGGGSRVLVHLDPPDIGAYDAAVASVTPAVERALGPGVSANRARAGGGRLTLEPWRPARRRYARAVQAAARGPSRAAFLGDVRECYGSITIATVERALRGIGVREFEIAAIAQVLRGFDARGVRGLPIGPSASAILANAVLASVDDALAGSVGSQVIRWVDDVIVFTPDARAARAAAEAFERALGVLGLAPNHGKCRIVDDPGGVGVVVSGPSATGQGRRGMMRAP